MDIFQDVCQPAQPCKLVWGFLLFIWAQLFKTNDVVSLQIVKTLIIKYDIYTNIFAEKIWVAFTFAKATHIFLAKIPVN